MQKLVPNIAVRTRHAAESDPKKKGIVKKIWIVDFGLVSITRMVLGVGLLTLRGIVRTGGRDNQNGDFVATSKLALER
jgi:hypothetical protein